MRLIDADVLKEAITQNREIDRNAVCDVLDLIDNAPTVFHDNYSMGYQDGVRKVLSEIPQGEWIICNQDNEGIHKIECPFCKCVKGSDFGGLITITFDRFPPFCENCGADMRVRR